MPATLFSTQQPEQSKEAKSTMLLHCSEWSLIPGIPVPLNHLALATLISFAVLSTPHVFFLLPGRTFPLTSLRLPFLAFFRPLFRCHLPCEGLPDHLILNRIPALPASLPRFTLLHNTYHHLTFYLFV